MMFNTDDSGPREVGPADVEFLEKVKESKVLVVFKVIVHGITCIMKVVSASSAWYRL